MTDLIEFEAKFDVSTMAAVMQKHPKEPWNRFTMHFNEKNRTNHTEGFLRIVRAISEDRLDCVGKSCERITEAQYQAVVAGLGLEKSHSDIAKFAGVSFSTVSRIYRVGVNLEFSQLKMFMAQPDDTPSNEAAAQ